MPNLNRIANTALLLTLFATPCLSSEPKRPLSFVNDVQPVLTKMGCNLGACHAKAVTGQRGFKLSVLG